MPDVCLPVPNTMFAILPFSDAEISIALQLADQLCCVCLPVMSPRDVSEYEQVLWVHPEGLAIQQTGQKAPGPVRVDFLQGAQAHRRLFGGGAGQSVAKAIGIKGKRRPTVLDATAGLGRDSFVLASLGCEVQMCERNPWVAALLADGMKRAVEDPEVGSIIERMKLFQQDGKDYLISLAAQPQALIADVIYLDPMFPHSDKSAEVKKDMKAFRTLVGADEDSAELLAAAVAANPCRIVVKRARKAPAIEGPVPSMVLEGKSGRFDIYTFRALPD